MSVDKQHAHELLDQLGPSQFAVVLQLLEVMLDPVSRSIAQAPMIDEEIGSKTAAELDQARASIERGEGIPHEEVMREFGLMPRT